MKINIPLYIALLTLFIDETYSLTFLEYKNKYNKKYKNIIEEKKREKIFIENKGYIESENKKNHTYYLTINKYTDITKDEFFNINHNDNKSQYKRIIEEPNIWDYQIENIKSQKNCGSCWAFSIIGAIEEIYKMKKRENKSLSVQQLIDCSKSFGNSGCNGGNPIFTYNYILQSKGICNEKDYPYNGLDGVCKDHLCNQLSNISSYVNITVKNGIALKKVLLIHPVSVLIETNNNIFQFYGGGIVTSNCLNNLDHAVLVVGYGINKNGKEYFIIRNSWGNDWGKNGYILLGADKMSNKQNNGTGICGILTMPTYPII